MNDARRSGDGYTAEIVDAAVLPDGSAFAVMSMPLPADHWLTQEGFNNPPMPLRCGLNMIDRQILEDMVEEVAKYAIRASTMNGKENDFDPDAMVRNFQVGMLGYFTDNGLSDEEMFNPNPVPKNNYGVGIFDAFHNAEAFMRTEPDTKDGKYPKARKLVIGFADGERCENLRTALAGMAHYVNHVHEARPARGQIMEVAGSEQGLTSD